MGVDPADPGGQPNPVWVNAPYTDEVWTETGVDAAQLPETLPTEIRWVNSEKVDAKPKRLSWWANE
jgi:hypothetical protein